MVIIAEWAVALLTFSVSLIFFVQTFSFPVINADPGGLALFPRVFSLFTGSGALLLMISLFKNNGGFSFVLDSLSKLSMVWRKDALDEESILIRNTVYAFLLCLIYPALIITIGFLPSTIIFIFLIMRVLGSKVLNSTLFSVALGGGLYYIFAIVIGVYLPTGKLWEFFLN